MIISDASSSCRWPSRSPDEPVLITASRSTHLSSCHVWRVHGQRGGRSEERTREEDRGGGGGVHFSCPENLCPLVVVVMMTMSSA
jgi:hypothetical protein